MVGETISHYKLLSQIGEGGMGVVYLGEQTNLNRKVAIKELHANLTSNPQFKERFINEAKILAKLSHPNIVTVYDLLSEGGRFFIVMEYITGENVSSYIIRSKSAFDFRRCLLIFRQVLSAFSYAHHEGIIHRDIKPSNIIIGPNDMPKVLDFGIAKITNINFGITKTGTKMGSVFYMSPEQVMGETVDKRTDVYSLGVTLFEMLTGTLPFNVDTDSEYKVQSKIVSEPLPSVRYYNPHLPENIDWIIAKSTAKRQQDRFSGCEEFYYAIENYFPDINKTPGFTGQPVTRTPPPQQLNATVAYQPRQEQNRTVAVPPPAGFQNKTVAVPPPAGFQNKTAAVQPPPAMYSQPAKKKSVLPFILIPVAIVFFICGVIGVYLFLTYEDDNKINTSGKSTKTEVNDEIKQKEEELKRREQKLEEEKKNLTGEQNTSGENSTTNTRNTVPGLYPEGSTRYLTNEDLQDKTGSELQIMRNEIFARHGYIFKSNPDMIEYFNNQSWYSPRYYDVTSMLSDVEQANVKMIQAYEKGRR